MTFSAFEAASGTRCRYSGSSTNWSLRGSADAQAKSSDPSGDLTVAKARSGPSPQTPIPEHLFPDVSLAALDETDEFHS